MLLQATLKPVSRSQVSVLEPRGTMPGCLEFRCGRVCKITVKKALSLASEGEPETGVRDR
ncbi:MAG: hypothetical protein DWI22_13380 [Planctomycetota bacterium]|nr:MAG: hypothetical protein DWI22_13380 [Planctomycetota bacterium]